MKPLKTFNPSIFQYALLLLAPCVVFFFKAFGMDTFHLLLIFWGGVIMAFLYAWVDLSFKNYQIYPDHIVSVTGIFNRNNTTVRFDEITNINWASDVTQRVFGIGNIHIDTAGGPGYELTLIGVQNPEKVADYIYGLKKGGV